MARTSKVAVSSGLSGEGSIFRRGRYYYLEFMVSGRRKKVSLKTVRKDEAITRSKEFLTPVHAKTREEVALHVAQARKMRFAKDIPLTEALALFAAGCRSLRPSTATDYSYKWQAFLRWLAVEYPQRTRVSDIDQQVAVAYGIHLESSCPSPRTFNANRNALSLITRKLFLRMGNPDADPWRFVATKTLDTISKQELSKEQVDGILAKLADAEYALPHRREWEVVFHLGAYAGLRLADTVLLRWQSVDLALGRLSLVPMKTARNFRRVQLPIHPALHQVLSGAAAWQDASGFVCPSLAERYNAYPTQVRKDAVRVFRDFGIAVSDTTDPKNRKIRPNIVGFHSLRHSFVSFCANAGVPMAVVQALVGHGSPAMTRHYTHISPEAASLAIQALPLGQDTRQLPPSPPAASRIADRVNVAITFLLAKPRLSRDDRQLLGILRGEP